VALTVCALWTGGCGSEGSGQAETEASSATDSGPPAGTSGGATSGSASTGTGGGTSGSTSGSGSTGTGSGTTGGGSTGSTGGTDSDTGGPAPGVVCEPPIGLVDTSAPDHVVGSGTPESCNEAALRGAVTAGGTITFDCGAQPHTISITQTLELPIDRDTTLDGGGVITLDGGDAVRILRFDSPNFRATRSAVTLQRITLTRGRAPAEDFTDDPGDGCAWGYKDGEGGALYVRDGIVRVIDATFVANAAAEVGPDTGGGAIYAVGSLEVTVVGSRFLRNSGSNSGAIGLLQSTATVVNSRFEGNRATGDGANYVQPGCPPFNHSEQGGAGGNGGAMAVDGEEPTELYFCGVEFVDNLANELGGAVFRTPNAAQQRTTFVRSQIVGNRAEDGGGGLYISNSLFTLDASLVANNTTPALGGGVRTERSTELALVNSTFWGNASEMGLAGALSHSDGGGEIRNCTFAGNTANGGPGLFTAAIRGTTASIHNSLFQDNTTLEPYNPMQCWFDPHPGAHNLQWPRTRSDGVIEDTPCVVDVVWGDAQLGPLQDEGGPTWTSSPASPEALGVGADCPPTDARGLPRPAQGCALGAVEP
jgi:hypothetical protein